MPHQTNKPSAKPRRPAATTPESRESQLVQLAVDLAEQQLANGTASVAVITHYLKLGTVRESMERERLEREIELLTAKTESLASAKNVEALYADAIKAIRTYGGAEDEDSELL